MEHIERALELARSQRLSGVAQGMRSTTTARGEGLSALARRDLGAQPTEPLPSARTVPLDRALLRERRVILPDDTDPAAHAYRMLRTQILRQARTQKLRMIGVVSSVDGEGKTLTAVNLAVSVAAEPNQTVLLVDLDLRRPSMAALLGLTVEAGLDSWLEGSSPDVASLFVRVAGLERLRVLPTVHPVSGSSEALAGARTQELLTELKTRYTDRLVIVDLPPALLSDDVLTIAPLLDGVLFVVSEGHTRREDVTRVKELLAGVRLLGTVLNASSEFERRTY